MTTQDLARWRLIARMGGARLQLVAIVRAARPATQALRGGLQSATVAAGRRYAHAARGTTRLTITSLHAKRSVIQAVLTN